MRTGPGRPQVRRRVGGYGTWASPITAEAVAGQSLKLGLVQSVGPWIYWSEGRPAEGGRVTLMRARSSGRPEELLPVPLSARSRVHEYGGGEFLVAGERVYFVNDKDQQVYSFVPGKAAERLTNHPNMRFADFAIDERRGRLLAAAERLPPGAQHPDNVVVAITLSGRGAGAVRDLVSGADFYAFPRPSPDGGLVAFVSWMLPDMPWDEAQLFIAEVQADGSLAKPRRIAGGKGTTVSEPVWTPAGTLLFIGDRTGHDNLYAWEPGKRVRAIAPRAADFGRPLWSLGAKSYAVLPNGQIAASFLEKGESRLALVDPATGAATPLVVSLRSADQIVAHGDGIAALATRDQAPPALVDISFKSGPKVIRSASPISLSKGMISRGRVVEFAGAGGEPVYAIHYAPANGLWQAPREARPPAIVLAHGGPTGAADRGLKLKIQYWTSRGFAVLDVDYSGSTGYGRAYRRRLEGRWGVRDVADLVAAGDYLVREGLADAGKLAISGGSAGGYSVLMTLAHSQRFAAGSCYYGISDLALLLAHTHKFESGYLHRLLGTTPDDWQATFAARSPIVLADRISAPLIVFQGKDDKVVPPEQSQLIVERLMRNHVLVEYWEFDAEGHGFRRAGTIATALERELAFFTRVMRLKAYE